MAYEVNVNAVMEVTIEGIHFGQQVMSTFHYRFDPGTILTIPDGRAACAEVLAELNAPTELLDVWLEAVSESVDQVSMYAQWITPTRYAYVANARGPAAGLIGERSDNINVSGTFVRRGDIADRHNSSVTHMPGVQNDATLSGRIVPAQQALYDEVMIRALESITIAGPVIMVPVAFNRSQPQASRQLTGGFVNDTARVMRRRTVGVGS